MSEREDITKTLNNVLKKLGKKYNSPPDETGIETYISGVSAIFIKGEPKFWFFNNQELIEWLRKVDDN